MQPNIELNDTEQPSSTSSIVVFTDVGSSSQVSTEFTDVGLLTDQPISDDMRLVVDAVYNYMKALRSMGRTHVNTAEIARALDLPLYLVELAARSLADRGVTIAS